MAETHAPAPSESPAPSPRPAPRVAIIGAGFSGICLGIELRRAGIESFTIFEKGQRIGGTWRDNTYPGAACDVPAFAYCFSFEQKTDWSRKWAPQSEIFDYMEHLVRKYGLAPHLRLGAEIVEARFDEARGVWQLRTAAGEEHEAEVLVAAVGQLNRPHVPDLPGLDRFQGEWFHSARWRHDLDLTGKTVAVVGNAASAIQFIPQIAPRVKQLYVFQRSAQWMLPRGDRPYTDAERRRFQRWPWLAKLYRWWIWLMFELRLPVIRRHRWLSRRAERGAERYMRSVIRDPELQEKLVPDYPIGGKRILISDDYYETLNRDNVKVVPTGADHLTEHAVVSGDGVAYPVDVVIFATGFETTSFLAPIRVTGLGGRSLHDAWKEGARAYLGMTVPGFPNFFLMYGPNTNLGHNSILFMLECQARYIRQAVEHLRDRDLAWMDLRPEVMEAWDARIQRELERTAWAATDHSWYKDARGRITNNWPGSTLRYWWVTRRLEPGAYRAQPRAALRTGGGGRKEHERRAAAAGPLAPAPGAAPPTRPARPAAPLGADQGGSTR